MGANKLRSDEPEQLLEQLRRVLTLAERIADRRPGTLDRF
jgi:hypothetical protein